LLGDQLPRVPSQADVSSRLQLSLNQLRLSCEQ
jgi:hypothetical protein